MLPYLFGIILIVTGFYWTIRKEISIRVEGKQALFIIKGFPAVVFGLIVAGLGIWVVLCPDVTSYFSFYRD